MVYVFHINNSCLPSLIGYWLLPECRESHSNPGWINTALKIGIQIFNHIALFVAAQVPIYVISGLQCLGNMIFVDCLRGFWAQLKLQIFKGPAEHACRIYQELQILGNFNNHIQQSCMTSSMIFTAIVFPAITLTAMIILVPDFTSGNLFPLIFFLFTSVDGFLLIMVLLGGMSLVYKESGDMYSRTLRFQNEALLMGVPQLNRAWKKGYFRPCASVKIRFGSDNFVDILTPLSLLNFPLGLVLQLLLVRKQATWGIVLKRKMHTLTHVHIFSYILHICTYDLQYGKNLLLWNIAE